MAEYIEREKLYNNLVLLAKYEMGERQQGILGCAETVRIFSAADVAPVVHGKWLRADDFIICSQCEAEMNQKNSLGVDNFKNYCPNCGARMQEVE